MIKGGQPNVETIIEPKPEAGVQPAQLPVEQIVEALAAELMRDLDIFLAPVVEPLAAGPRASASTSTTAPLADEQGPRPEIGMSGSPLQVQTNKVVLMAENLLKELITW
jgi:hypothetical protein